MRQKKKYAHLDIYSFIELNLKEKGERYGKRNVVT